MSSPHSDNEEGKGYSAHMSGVALGILVMGVSLAVVIILWIEFGYIGPAFSTQVMQQQQETLRKQYGLPPEPALSPKMLEVPPSLRSVAAGANATTAGANATTAGANATTAGANATTAGANATTAGANATTAGANATTAGANATTAGANATTAGANATTAGANATTAGANATTAGANATTAGANATTAGATGNTTGTSATSAGGSNSVSIVSGASSLTTTAYDPNPVQVKVGSKVTWTNNDSQPHTVTSGSNGQPDNKFNSSPNFNPLLNPGQTFSFTFTQAGDYPYFCMLHPNMVGTVNVSS